MNRLIACMLMLVAATGVAQAGMIVNGDFESGNTGFTTEYVYAPTIQPFPGLNGGEYNIVTDPDPYHFAAPSYGDHTSGNGLMMMVNADRGDNPNLMVWSQTVAVISNANYDFSAWISTWAIAGNLNVSRLDFLINGSSIGKQTAPSTTAVWEQFSTTWNSGASTSALIQIYEVGDEIGFPGGGNDFALDDISFRPVNPVPEPTSLAIFGVMGLATLSVRRRRWAR
ncbi:PEP-CTERM sorting domain-containing protein [Stieleria sp. ICT_E10.1]|uniref:PEP-CTERM sorting domain-containing protein n=1 Tax=Stieleria sedimenti TaxID=2976331 RepID=UPI00217F3608|nr:PEP-CTERM sorting domain-containing protein [Stieleria sedimenti]MCS7469553.1 PEP-CTERM sorting domain-containing protein [Stieleria sedimenti]